MKSKIVTLTAFALIAMAVQVSAHHAFSSVFDRNSPVSFVGTVTSVEWMNPHTWFYLDIESDDGEIENWGFEMGSPNTLVRRGWSRDSLKVGEVVAVIGFQARDGSARAAVRSVALPSGERLFGAQDESR